MARRVRLKTNGRRCFRRSWRAPSPNFAVHWDHEPLAVPCQKESADKSDALQTLRAVRRRPAVAKRLECVRLQRRFPKPGYDSMTGPVHGRRNHRVLRQSPARRPRPRSSGRNDPPGGVAPLHAARTSQRDVPTTLNGYDAEQSDRDTRTPLFQLHRSGSELGYHAGNKTCSSASNCLNLAAHV